MKTIIYKTFLLLCTVAFTANISYSQYYDFYENFNGSFNGWYVKNNSNPQPYLNTTWSTGGSQEGYLGPQYGAPWAESAGEFLNRAFSSFVPFKSAVDYFAEYKYGYASVGYSSADWDGAHISQWLISPVIYNVKNGDELRFLTRRKSFDVDDRIASIINLETDMFTDGNRPNRLHVRMWNVGSYDVDKSPNVGNTPTSVGDFTIELSVINPQLDEDGYPSGWQERIIPLNGLPANKLTNVRIAFWYEFENGGYNNMRARFEFPISAEARLALDVASEFSDAVGTFGDIFSYVEKAAANFSKINGGQVGKNGTYIAIDNVKVISKPEIVLFGPDGSYFTGNRGNSASYETGTLLGYAGSPECPNGLLESESTFIFNNGSNETVDLYAHLYNDYLNDFSVSVSKNTVAPGERAVVKVNLIKSIFGVHEPTVYVELTNFPIQGVHGAGINTHMLLEFKADISDSKPPTVKATDDLITLTLDDNDQAILTNPENYVRGYNYSCGDSLTFSFGGNQQKTFNCDNLGLNKVGLTISDENGMSSYDLIDVYVKPNPIMVFDTDTVKFYVTDSTNSMNVSLLTPPAILDGCDNGTFTGPYISNNYGSLGTPEEVGVGEYYVNWIYRDPLENSKYTGYNLSIIDTIKPQIVCQDYTLTIGFNDKYNEQGYNVSGLFYGYDMQIAYSDNDGIDDKQPYSYSANSFTMSTSWYGNGMLVQYIPFNCNDAGDEFVVTTRVYDYSGNYSSCETNVRIASPDQPECKDLTVNLPENGFKYINASELLLSSSENCGIKSFSVSQSLFDCDDVNMEIPVTVTYIDAVDNEHSCQSMVSVSQITELDDCADTVKLYVPANSLTASYDVGPIISTSCIEELTWSASASGVTNFNKTNLQGGTFSTEVFNTGITHLTRTTVYLDTIYECTQVVAVYDTIAPVIRDYDYVNNKPLTYNDTLRNIYTIDACTFEVLIANPFQQGTYHYWSYNLSGATEDSAVYYKGQSYYEDGSWYYTWQDRTLDLVAGDKNIQGSGVTHIRLSAFDYAGNESIVEYDFDIQAEVLPLYIYSDELDKMNDTAGDFCGGTYNVEIESPFFNLCNRTDYYWFYEVYNAANSNELIYSRDSIPEEYSADIPLKIGPKYNQTVWNKVKLGYYSKVDGSKVYGYTSPYITIQDTVINAPECTGNIIVESTNDSTYTYPFAVNPPKGLCNGDFWGFSVNGATNYSSKEDPSVVYSSNQENTLNLNTISDAYPVFSADSIPVVDLNIGLNYITISTIEENGNYESNNYCVFEVNVVDVTVPGLGSASDVVLHRGTTGACEIEVGSNCDKINGFAGPFGKSFVHNLGDNPNISLDRSQMPESIQFTSINDGISYNDAYIKLKFNCTDTLSFNWEYQNNFPSFFRPFILVNSYFEGSWDQTLPAGFDSNSSAIQNGTFSQIVNAGDVLYIGLTEGGAYEGYFKISNLKAPYKDVTIDIPQPTFIAGDALYLESDVRTSYPIGDYVVTYILKNMNNGNTDTTYQNISIIDDYAEALATADDTIYLNSFGTAVLNPEQLVTSCFPITSTTVSKDTFLIDDIGTQSITVTGISQSGDTLTSSVNVTVLDTIKPKLIALSLDVDLISPTFIASISDSLIRSYFTDNWGIDSVSASETTFDCNNIGANNVNFSAVDSAGNSASYPVLVNVYPNGFELNDPGFVDSVCVGEPITLSTKSGVRGSREGLSFQWQMKQANLSEKPWNLYTSIAGVDMVNGGNYYKFQRSYINQYHDNTYMVYLDGTSVQPNINFKILDENNQSWLPVFQRINREVSNMPGTNESFFLDFSDNAAKTPFVLYLDKNGRVNMERHLVNGWDSIYPFYSGYNIDFHNLYYSDDYFFAVHYTGYIHAGKVNEYATGISTEYNLYKPGSAVNNTYVTNAKNIVGIRNDFNQNMFFSLTENASGILVGKDSLTNDPTDNSPVFAMQSFNDTAYVAYKSTNGKLSVKKYLGNNTWSIVGSADLSTNTITKVDIEVINNELYVLYQESNDSIFVKKWLDISWEALVSPNHGNNISNFSSLKLYDIAGVPSFYTGASNSYWRRLYRNDGWQNVPSSPDSYNYSPSTNQVSDILYRCITSANGCAFTVSGNRQLKVHEIPNIVVSDAEFTGLGITTLNAIASIGEVTWVKDSVNGSWAGNGSIFTTPPLANDAIYYAYAINKQCSSDTVAAHVFVNDHQFADYNITYPDSICYRETAEIKLDTVEYGMSYSIYTKSANGNFTKGNIYYNNAGTFTDYPQQTTEYKIKIEEKVLDAARMSTSGSYYDDYLDFGNPEFDITDSFTIEAYVYGNYATSPNSILGLAYSNGGYYDAANTRNWEWVGGYFKVHNGNTTRQLAFPSLASRAWTHIATTAGPNGLAIYYNGQLVASSSDTSAVNINNATANLVVGKTNGRDKPQSLMGFDEFRIWNTVRDSAQIVDNMNECLTGYEDGLLIYNEFSEFNATTNAYISLLGNDAVYQNESENTPAQIERNASCISGVVSEKFLPSFTIHVRNGASQIETINGAWNDFWSTSSDTCGGEIVQLTATTNMGTVFWFDSLSSGNIIGSGDTLNLFANKDTIVYVGPESVCERYPVFVDVNGTPEILSITNDTVCANDEIMSYDFNFNIEYNNEAYDYLLYDAPVGGNLVMGNYPAGCAGGGAPPEGLIDGPNGGIIFTETDTLYAVGINNCCVGSNRIPVIIHVLNPQLTSVPTDTSICEGTISLHASAINYDYIKWYTPDGGYVKIGDTIVTHYMTDTNTWQVKAVAETENITCDLNDYTLFDINITPLAEHYDTVLACGSYTWIDDSTYTQSDSNIVFYRDYGAICDSVYHLNLKISTISERLITASETNICPGDSTTIAVTSAQNGFKYSLRDTSAHSIIDGPFPGTGTNIVFNTGALTDTTGFEIYAEKTTVFAGDTLTCNKILSSIIIINVGETGSQRNAFACESYIWKGNTYTTTGIYYDTVASVQGCDSILTLNLTILPISNVTETITACESYTWHDSTYTMSTDSSIWTGINPYGCDSVVTLNLTINYSNTGDTSAVACESFNWFGNTYTTSGAYNHTVANVAGCDSVVTLNLTINDVTTGDTTVTSYGEFTWYGTVYDSTGNYNHTLVNVAGCDSVVTLHLTYLPNFDASLSSLIYNDTTVTGFNTDTLVYNEILPYQSTIVPTVVATPTDDDASAVVTDAASLPGTTTITVTAEDGTTQKVYSINFTVREGTEANGMNDWASATGWDNGVPDSTTTVVIAGGTTTVTSNAVCYNLIVKGGATVKVDSGKTLTVLENVIVNGELTNTGTITGPATKSLSNTFILKSDSTGTASYIGSNPENLIVIAERYLASSSRWWYVSPPISNATGGDFNATNVGDKLYEYDTENAMWTEITTDTALNIGRGYATKQNVDYEVLQFEGTLNYGDITLNLIHAGNSWNLAGNPYPSAVDMESLSGSDWQSVSKKYWVKSGNNFKTYNVLSDEATNGGSRYIPAMQAFWVKVIDDTASIKLSDADRLHNSVTFAKKVASINKKVRLKVSYNNYSDETVIGFNPNASDEFDGWDTEKKFANGDNYPQLYTKTNNGEELAVNFLRKRNEVFTIPVYFSTPDFGQHTIQASDFNSMGSVGVFLEDLHEDKLVYLNVTPEYTFESLVTEEEPRFILHIYPLSATSVAGIVYRVNVYAFNKSVYIQMQEMPDDGFVTVYDALGRAVASKNVVKNSLNRIEIKDASGWYLVKMISGNVMINKKVYIR